MAAPPNNGPNTAGRDWPVPAPSRSLPERRAGGTVAHLLSVLFKLTQTSEVVKQHLRLLVGLGKRETEAPLRAADGNFIGL